MSRVRRSQRRVRVELHRGQARAYTSPARYVAVIAGTGGGKTYLGPVWLTREIGAARGGEFLVAAPTYKMLERVVLPRALAWFEQVLPGEFRAKELAYHAAGGVRVYFGSAEKPYTLEGPHCHAVWLDEAGQMKREAWDVAQRRVGFHRGRVLLTTTPYNLGWLKTEVYDRWRAGDRDYCVVQFPSVENPAYPREEFERARATLPDWKFRMFYLGQFARPEGLVYRDFDPGRHVVEPFEIPRSWRRFLGVDWGYNNPTAVLWVAVDPDGRMFVYREYYRRGRLPAESAADVKELSRGENIEAAFCDPEDPAAIRVWREAGIPAKPADNAVKEGIEAVIAAIRSDRLRVFRGLANFLDELENYTWRDRGSSLKDEPVREYDHLMDALRYCVVGIVSRKRGVGVSWL